MTTVFFLIPDVISGIVIAEMFINGASFISMAVVFIIGIVLSGIIFACDEGII